MIQPRPQTTLADRLDHFLAEAAFHHVKVRTLKLSLYEFRALLDDPDGRDRYSDGAYREIPIEFVTRCAGTLAWIS